jgi:hypothetical protein
VKLRIRGNSLRLRLNRSDVEQFHKTGICAEVIRFGPGSELTYTLEVSLHLKAIGARYHQNCIRVLLPLDMAEQWVGSEQVSLSLRRDDDNGPSLLVEKDFQCLNCDVRDPTEDANSFPNPSAEDNLKKVSKKNGRFAQSSFHDSNYAR